MSSMGPLPKYHFDSAALPLCIRHLCCGYREALGSFRAHGPRPFAQATQYSDNHRVAPAGPSLTASQHCCLTVNVPCDQKRFLVNLTYQGYASQHPPGVMCHTQAEERCGDMGGGIQSALNPGPGLGTDSRDRADHKTKDS